MDVFNLCRGAKDEKKMKEKIAVVTTTIRVPEMLDAT